MTILYILAAVLLFGILITVHEAGHFFAARALGIPVREFAIGFGPKLYKWKRRKHETEFFLRAIPLGGYCAFYGEDDTTGAFRDDPRSFSKHPVWKRLLTILTGPVMNLVLAFLVAVILYTLSGVPVGAGPFSTTVQSVTEGGAAQAAGMLPGDVILQVDGQPVTDNLSEAIDRQPGGITRRFQVQRVVDGQPVALELDVTPEYNADEGRSLIGILMTVSQPVTLVKGSPGEVIRHAYNLSYQAGSMVFRAIRDLFTRGEGLGEVSGVVGITKMIVDEIGRTQWVGYLYLMVVISINLGLMNLLIIPGLDGSRIVFLVIEAIRGKPIKKEGYVHAAGMVLLFGLMIAITFRDILRLF